MRDAAFGYSGRTSPVDFGRGQWEQCTLLQDKPAACCKFGLLRRTQRTQGCGAMAAVAALAVARAASARVLALQPTVEQQQEEIERVQRRNCVLGARSACLRGLRVNIQTRDNNSTSKQSKQRTQVPYTGTSATQHEPTGASACRESYASVATAAQTGLRSSTKEPWR